jgi:hypothetical protein
MICRLLSLGTGGAALLFFSGCAFMPPGGERAEFRDPPPMDRTLSKAGQGAGAPGNDWPQDEWWHQFGSPDLDRVMELALGDNPGLKKAYARLGEADSLAQVEGARLLPWLDSVNTFSQLRYAKHGVVASYNPALGGTVRTSDSLNPHLMLQNRIYRGEIAHQGTAYPGQHEAIVDLELGASCRRSSSPIGMSAPCRQARKSRVGWRV